MSRVLNKVAEYLTFGVRYVWVLNPDIEGSFRVYRYGDVKKSRTGFCAPRTRPSKSRSARFSTKRMPTIAMPTRAAEFKETLGQRVLVADGAMGTVLYAKGVFIHRCIDELNLSLPGAGSRRPPGIHPRPARRFWKPTRSAPIASAWRDSDSAKKFA